MNIIKELLPKLTHSLHKGQCGKIGVVGGSFDYTGAPFFSAISSLKLGADVVHVFAPAEAAAVIKTYSPELMVHPSLNAFMEWVSKVDVVVLGPGLGRSEETTRFVRDALAAAKAENKPTVVDADGLFAIAEAFSTELTFPAVTVLTPNAMEMDRLSAKIVDKHTLNEKDDVGEVVFSVAKRLNVPILLKGEADTLYHPTEKEAFPIKWQSSPRRAGGIGDIMSGVLATFLLWATRATKESDESALVFKKACKAASTLVHECAKKAYEKHGRSMTATDVIAEIGPIIKDIDNGRSSL